MRNNPKTKIRLKCMLFYMSNKLVLHNNSLDHVTQAMNVFICAIVRIFSFGKRLIVPFILFLPLYWYWYSIHIILTVILPLYSYQNILTIALINIHYLYIVETILLHLTLICFLSQWQRMRLMILITSFLGNI